MESEVGRFQLEPVRTLPLGLVAREAIFRTKDLLQLSEFLNSNNPPIAIRWLPKIVYEIPTSIPEFSLWTGNHKDANSLNLLSSTKLNLGRPIIVLGHNEFCFEDQERLASIPWDLHYLDAWSQELKSLCGIKSNSRDNPKRFISPLPLTSHPSSVYTMEKLGDEVKLWPLRRHAPQSEITD